MIDFLMALPFGSGYPLQSPDEKSGGFPLLSLTQKGGGQLITDFYNNCKLMFTMRTKATTRNCIGMETWKSRRKVYANFLGIVFTLQAALMMHLQDLKNLKELKELLWWFIKPNVYIC
jgi:hypothetical protein